MSGQFARLRRLGPPDTARLIRFVPVRRAAKRFRFEKRIEIARYAIRSQLRANLPKRIRDFRRIVEIRAKRKIFNFGAEREYDRNNKRPRLRISLQQALHHLPRSELCVHMWTCRSPALNRRPANTLDFGAGYCLKIGPSDLASGQRP